MRFKGKNVLVERVLSSDFGGRNPPKLLIYLTIAHLEKLMSNKKFPIVTKELLDELEKRYPDRMPDIESGGLDVVRYKQGQVSVIRLLRKQFESQTMNVLEIK